MVHVSNLTYMTNVYFMQFPLFLSSHIWYRWNLSFRITFFHIHLPGGWIFLYAHSRVWCLSCKTLPKFMWGDVCVTGWWGGKMIKLCCYMYGPPGPPDIPRGVSGCQAQADQWSAPAADSSRDVWWTVSLNYTVLSLSCDVKNSKLNQYIYQCFWHHVMCRTQDFGYSSVVMFWMWRHHDMALWRQEGGLGTMVSSWWQLATPTAELMLLTTWLDCGKRVIRKSSNAGSRARYGSYHDLELSNHRMVVGVGALQAEDCLEGGVGGEGVGWQILPGSQVVQGFIAMI